MTPEMCFIALGRAEQHLAIVAAVVLGAFGVDGVEALLDGAGGFVGGEDALAGRDHGLGDFVQFCEIHGVLLDLRRNPSSICISGDLAAVGRHFCLNTSTPGSGLPSSHSRKAPPAVET